MRTMGIRALALVATLVLATAAGEAQTFKKGVYGTVVDDAGKPVAGVVIQFARSRDDFATPSRVYEIKTNERGTFVYPSLSEDPGDFYINLKSDEYFIRGFHFRTRRGTGEIWQDDEVTSLPPTFKDLPALRWRVANCVVDLTLMKRADYKAPTTAPKAAAVVTPDQAAEEAAELGDYKGAADKLTPLVEAEPGNVERRWKRAQYLAKSGDTETALREGRKVVALKPDMKGVRPLMAAWLSEAGQDDASLKMLEEERTVDPTNKMVHRFLYVAYKQAGNTAAADEALAKWAELAPDDNEALVALAGSKAAKGDFAGAEQIFRKLAEADPANAYKMFYNVGASIYNSKGDMNLAVEALKKSIELKADYPKSYLTLGYVLLNQGKLAEARQPFEKFLELAPNDPQAGEIKKMLAGLPKK